MTAAQRAYDPELFKQDMKLFASIADAFSDTAGKQAVRDLKGAYERLMELTGLAAQRGAEVDRILAGKKDAARLNQIKSELEVAVVELRQIQEKRVPELMQRLQAAAPSEAVRAQLKQITDTVNKRPDGIAVEGEVKDDKKGIGGSDLWS